MVSFVCLIDGLLDLIDFIDLFGLVMDAFIDCLMNYFINVGIISMDALIIDL